MGINISNKSYRDDFLRVINDLELKGDEFEVRESFCSTAVIPPNVGFTKQEVTVRYMPPSGVEKEYNAGGHLTNWVDDFRKDWVSCGRTPKSVRSELGYFPVKVKHTQTIGEILANSSIIA